MRCAALSRSGARGRGVTLAGARRGFTLVEMLVSLVIFAALISVAVTLFTSQVRAFTAGTERSELTIAGSFASSTLSRQLRTAGTNTIASQPWLVYGDTNVIAFHADLVSRVPDPFAVYIDPDAPSDIVQALPQVQKYTLPLTTFTFPDTTYFAATGVLADAELIVFWFAPDTSTTRTDDFVLMRRVNAAAPEIIARNLLRTPGEPFLRYFRLVADTLLQAVPQGQLPLRHVRPLHLSAADSGVFARIDSVRAVRFSFTTSNGRAGAAERRLEHNDLVWFRNGGLAKQRTCGSAPIFTSTVTAIPEIIDGAPAVRVQWTPSLDETSGEEDVIRYVLWRTSPFAMPGDPLISIPAGAASYEHLDKTVQPGEEWIYAVAAQDCTPLISAPIATGTVVVPNP